MSAEEAIDLLNYAFEAETEDKLFQRWIPQAQNFVSFEEFKNSLKQPKKKTDKELNEDAELILDSMVI